MTKSAKSTVVTEFSQFYRATADGETRYYPANGVGPRDASRAFDPNAVLMGGFGVYDTTLATEWAIAVYGDKQAALAHKAAEPAPAPVDAFEDAPAPEGKNPHTRGKKGKHSK